MLIIRVLAFGFWGNGIPLFDGSGDIKIHCCEKVETCDAGAGQLKLKTNEVLPNPYGEIDHSDTEEVDEMKIIGNASDVDSDIDVEDQLRLAFPFCLVQ